MKFFKITSFPLLIASFLVLGCVRFVAFDEARAGGINNAAETSYEERQVIQALRAQAGEWNGVRYRTGGLSKSGIDCSGFVYVTFQELFGMSIPRTTKSLARFGSRIPARAVRAGDLVFFRTGARKRHVGIYVEKGMFVHASTSRGVMVSSLEEEYWAETYRGARRVLSY